MTSTALEIQFNLRGKTLPSSHGYEIYAAIKKQLRESVDHNFQNLPQDLPQELHLCSISGVPDGTGTIHLTKSSKFRVRCPADQAQLWYRFLQNQVLDIKGHLIRLIQPRLTVLEPSDKLISRLVIFKMNDINNTELPVYFLESCQKALTHLDIEAKAYIPSHKNGDLARGVLSIKGKKIVGYRVVVENLKMQDSLKLQQYGLGGRQHFGCGWFYPSQEEDRDVD